jgi:thioredoxin 1
MSLYNITTSAEFIEKVISNDKVVLVDFWAQWCPPCRAMAPVLEAITKKLDGKVDVVKVDVEASTDNARYAQQYGVQGIPNMQIFVRGKVVDVLVGMRPEAALVDELNTHLV